MKKSNIINALKDYKKEVRAIEHKHNVKKVPSLLHTHTFGNERSGVELKKRGNDRDVIKTLEKDLQLNFIGNAYYVKKDSN